MTAKRYVLALIKTEVCEHRAAVKGVEISNTGDKRHLVHFFCVLQPFFSVNFAYVY